MTATVGEPVTQRPAVTVLDQRGDPMFGVAVTFAVSAGGGSVTGATVFSDAQGLARVESWTLGTATGTNTLRATAGSLTSVTFNASAQAAAPATLTRTAGDEQTATVGTAVNVAPAVTVRDRFNNPVPNATVTFAVAGGGGSVTAPAAFSSNAGVASVGSWTLGAVPGANSLSATLDTLVVTFTATGVVGAPATMTKHAGDAQTAVAATAVATPPAVRLIDLHGNPVSGVSITFGVTAAGGSVTGATQTTDANGIATVGSWTLGSVAGANTLTASAGTLSAIFTATSVPGVPANITVHAGDQQTATVASGVTVPPAVRVTDAHGNPLAAMHVMFAVTSGGGSVSGAVQTTDINGIATAGGWTLGTVAGNNTLSATTGTLNVTFTATGVAGAPANITKHAGDTQTATVGTAVSTAPAVRITDTHGNPLAGVSVEFSVSAGGGSVTGGVQTTNANGVATVGSWTLGTTAVANSLTATAGALTAVFTATALPDAPDAIEKIAGDGQTTTVATSVPIVPAVRVVDQFGNVVPGITVTFAVTAGGGLLTGASPVTDAGGAAAVGSWTLGTVAGANELTASVGTLSAAFTAPGTPGAPASIVAIAGEGQSATVNTTVPTAPSVRVTDAHGNDVSGVTVTFTVESGGGSVAGGTQTTDTDGTASVDSWTLGTTAGANTLRATAGSVSVVFSATGTAGAPSSIVKQAGDAQSATVNTAVVPARTVSPARIRTSRGA
jgi:adhesin/invasin